MAITTEPEPQLPKPDPSNPNLIPTSSPNPFTFWAYFTITLSLITLIFTSLSSSLYSPDPKSWFLSLPDPLRTHYSMGRTIKVQTSPNQPQIDVFAYENGLKNNTHLLLIHGLGCNSFTFSKLITLLSIDHGMRVVALDLPGFGFSDKSVVMEVDRVGGVLGKFFDVYDEIKEKGLFWAFDEIISTGQIPYEEIGTRVEKKRKIEVPVELGNDEIGRVLGQVVDSIELDGVHLVLHDSALSMGANWVSENLGLVKSLTLIDTDVRKPALPIWVLDFPLIRDVVLEFPLVFDRFVKKCCSRSMEGSEVEAHRVLLKGRDGRRAVVGAGKKLNSSFDLGEWRGLNGIKDMPIQVIWSSNWSEEWSEEGRRVADVLKPTSFVTHSGNRWPQEDAAEEIAENIAKFLSSLPKSVRKAQEEPIPDHVQKPFDKAEVDDHHGDEAGFMHSYGLDHALGS